MTVKLPKTWSYLQRWFLFGIVIGVVSGLGAEAFNLLLRFVTEVFLVGVLNYTPPAAGGEGLTVFPNLSDLRWWLLPLVVGLGGLVSGIIVYSYAPEAEGHGTDSMIDSFHRKGGMIRSRVPIVKMVASAITIGTGGSAGREGPIAQIGAGFGSWLASRLRLGDHERRMMVLCGAAAGIGAIFKAPLGASLFITEVLYKKDMEVEVLFPAFISSVVSYSIYASINGFEPIFGAIAYEFSLPQELALFVILGLICALGAIVYVNVFYGLRDRFFRRLPLPNLVKPAIGGVMVGILAMQLPETLEMGYGWVQLALYGQLSIGLMLIIAVTKMVSTSLTISSGGSGGVFAPSLVIGGLLGGAVGTAFNAIAPGFVSAPSAFILVGMAAFFAAAAKVPISAMIMVAEMTRNYNFLIPAMFACGISYIASGRWTLYENQVETRTDSPAHLGEYNIDLLEEIRVKDIMTTRPMTVAPSTKIEEVNRLMARTLHLSYPVVDGGVLVGMVTYKELLRIPKEDGQRINVGEIMMGIGAVVHPEDTAAEALRVLHNTGQEQLPVVDPGHPGILVGILTHNDIIHGHEASKLGTGRRKIANVLERVHVEEVMRRDLTFIDAGDPLKKMLDTMLTHRYKGYPVLDEGRLVGVVTVDQMMKAICENREEATARDIMSTNYPTASPDEPVSSAMRKMYLSKVGRLPVVYGDKPEKIVGIITKTDIIRAWELEEPIDLSKETH